VFHLPRSSVKSVSGVSVLHRRLQGSGSRASFGSHPPRPDWTSFDFEEEYENDGEDDFGTFFMVGTEVTFMYSPNSDPLMFILTPQTCLTQNAEPQFTCTTIFGVVKK